VSFKIAAARPGVDGRPLCRNLSGLARMWRRNSYGYLFLLPWLIGLVSFTLFPMLSSLFLSLTDYSLGSRFRLVGMYNYSYMFTRDTRYMTAVRVTFKYVLLGVPLQLIMALALALVLNRGIPGLSVFRTLFYVPSLLGGSVAIALLWRRIFSYDGVFNQLLIRAGYEFAGSRPTSWVTDPRYALNTLILLHVWQFGSPMIIFLAGLRQIPAELYEAAEIDGAGTMNRFRFVTLPMLSPIIFFNLVMQTINAFQAFTPAFIVGGGSTGGVLDSLLFYTLYLYFLGFVEFRMGYACALAWVLFIVIAVITALLFRSGRLWVFYAE